VISSTKYNNVINDIATGLSLCLTKDGQQVATANIPFGGFRATNVGITAIAGSVGTPAINVSDATTGFYRSAVSEIAVSISGTQVARFDSTGLVMTGGVSGTQLTLTTAASRIIPGATSLSLRNNANNADNLLISDAGAVTVRTTLTATTSIVTPTVDSGTTGSLSFKTNNGSTQFQVVHIGGTIVDNLTVEGSVSGGSPAIRAVGTDANIGVQLATKGTSSFFFAVNNAQQLEIQNTASATRWATITGSNGGNPTLGVTAGNLAITPTVIIAQDLFVLSGFASAATSGSIKLAYSNGTTGISMRNSGGSADLNLLDAATVNAVVDVERIGAANTAGTIIRARSGGAAPNTTDLPASMWTVWRDTGGGTTKIYYNNAGAIIASAAFS
jgi:hypothetical protein